MKGREFPSSQGAIQASRLEKEKQLKNQMKVTLALFSLGVATIESQATITPPDFQFRVFESGVASGGEACNFGSVNQVSATEWFFQGNHSNTNGTWMIIFL